ncbi:SCO family protein [Parasegetibacter sp. NRK P23]|uniref:SCO family protein n=1 Tax=Parasegetibacter sp. NRK P23 TaxID=2942999 RepID=UPI002044120E|nr:SCO family protein [Parasegetibacter sp. NRK P23]MCM5529735.1 SCO family protein [Parasegetibacter sp. NRK P23]
MGKKLMIYLGIFVVLVGGFFFFIYGDNDLWKTKLPVLNYTKEFSFTDQYGKRITDQDVKGKVYVAEYFFTTCPGICPRMNNNLKGVYEKYKNKDGFAILSHTVDPEKDTVGRMKHYADSLGVNTPNWLFLTGPKDSLYNVARASYLLDDPANAQQAIDEQFIHTQFFALVDKGGRVRGIYDGLKTEEIAKLEKDISDLLKENTPQRTSVQTMMNQ